MTGLLALYRIVIFLFFITIVSAQEYPDKKVHNFLKTGIHHLIEQDYKSAEKIFSHLKKDYPDLPLGDIYLAAVEISRSVDYGTEFQEELISKHLSSAEEMSMNILEKGEEELWANYFVALGKGYFAYYQALQKDYISAFGKGISSVNYFEKCLKIDSTFYEAYTAIGTYQYWKSEKTEFINWLPFVSDEKESGIINLQKSIHHKTYTHYLALNSLIWIYINKKEYKKAIEITEDVLKRYPDSRLFKQCLLSAYKNVDKKKAIDICYELLHSYMQIPENNHLNEIIMKHKIAMLYEEIGENKKALKLCNEILNTNIKSEFVTEQLDKRLDRVKKLQKELSEG